MSLSSPPTSVAMSRCLAVSCASRVSLSMRFKYASGSKYEAFSAAASSLSWLPPPAPASCELRLRAAAGEGRGDALQKDAVDCGCGRQAVGMCYQLQGRPNRVNSPSMTCWDRMTHALHRADGWAPSG